MLALLLLADVPQIIQVEWQALAVFGSAVGGALVAAAKIIASQLSAGQVAQTKRHEENRADAREARDENRALSQAILTIQGKTVETLAGLQSEIERIVTRLDRIDGGLPKVRHQ